MQYTLICFYRCKGLLLHTRRHTHTHAHTDTYVKEQPLLHTCREQVSQLSFVFEPGLRLSTVTTHPSSNPCIDIATDVISDCFKETMDDANSFLEMGPRPLKPHGLLPERPEKWILGIAEQAVHNLTSIIILISYFDFWVLAKNKNKKNNCEMSYPLLSMTFKTFKTI